MSEPGQKRSRKTKLVPRSFKDYDDRNKLQPLQVYSRKTPTASKPPSSIESKHDEPSTSSYQPLKFDIKIEVESCDEDVEESVAEESMGTTSDFLSDMEIKTEIINENDLFEVEERDINSLLADALSKKKSLSKKSKTLAHNDHDYSPMDKKTSKELLKRNINKQQPSKISYLRFDTESVLNALEELCKEDMPLQDRILEIEMRNMWGRCRNVEHIPTVPDKKIQAAFNCRLKSKALTQSGKTPLVYKCYICEEAWWHLGPFRDHLYIHGDDLRVEVEPLYLVVHYNIVAFTLKSKKVKDFPIDSNCWICGYDYQYHINVYQCTYCNSKFQTCRDSLAHEAECVKKLKVLVKQGPIVVLTCHLCGIKLLNKEKLEEHYVNYHNVRSDLPMCNIGIRTCVTCSKSYISMFFHYCSEKNYTLVCMYCKKRYPSGLALDIHVEKQIKYSCVICGYELPQRCMIAEHMLVHTDKFVMLHKCLMCKENVLLFDEESAKKHKVVWHMRQVDRRRNYFEMVLAPRSFVEAQNIEELVIPKKDSLEKPIKDDGNIDPSVQIKVEVEVESDVHINAMDILDSDKNKPSTSYGIKEEATEIDEFNDEIVEENIIEGIQNNGFTEDDEGYEYILSNVFNAGNNMLYTELTETDDFEELINKEQEKSKKKPKMKMKKVSSKATSTVISNDEEKLATYNLSTNDFGWHTCFYEGCYFIAEDGKQLKSHLLSHKFVISCSKCLRSFGTIRGYLLHLKDHGYPQWSCPECLKCYASYASVTAHVRGASNRSFTKTKIVDKSRNKQFYTYKCKKCKETVNVHSTLDHWEKHIDVSDKKVVDKPKEMTVEESKIVDKEYPGVRGMVAMNPAMKALVIQALVDTEHRKGDDKKTCLVCGRNFERRHDCKRHHIEHLLADAYSTKIIYKGLQCQICHQTFARVDVYKQHMRDHAHLPLNKCNLCFKTFSDSSNFVKHKKTHSSMYVCDTCNKKFQAKFSLIKHMQSHSMIDPIKCKYCTKIFYSESDYNRHIRKAHTNNIFKFCCIICKEKFQSVKDKWDHMWIEHKERQVNADCPICNAEFRKISDVKRHVKVEHDLEISVMNVRLFKQFLQKMNQSKDNPNVTVKTEPGEETCFVVRDQKRSVEFYSKNDLVTMMNDKCG